MTTEEIRVRIAELADTRWNTLNEHRRVGTAFPEPFDALTKILDFVDHYRLDYGPDAGASPEIMRIVKIIEDELRPRPAVLKPEADDVTSTLETASQPTRLVDRDRKIWWFAPVNGLWWNEKPFSPGLPLDELRKTRGPLIELKENETPHDLRPQSDRFTEANERMFDIFRQYNVTEVNGEPWDPRP